MKWFTARLIRLVCTCGDFFNWGSFGLLRDLGQSVCVYTYVFSKTIAMTLVSCISMLVRIWRHRSFVARAQQDAMKCFSNVGGRPKEEWVLATVGNTHMHRGAATH